MNSEQISRVRSFNRAVTLQAGALDADYLSLGRPLAETRLLYEIGRTGASIADLRQRLGLDAGYLSRLMRALRKDDLIELRSHPADARCRTVMLTDGGLQAWDLCDQLSDRAGEDLLAPLSPSQRARLTSAMAEVERLLTAASVTIAAEDMDGAAARLCLDAYFAELEQRFQAGFDPAAGEEPAKSMPQRFFVARLAGRPVGCGALRMLHVDTAEIKRMWVSPDVRGAGLAGRLLETLETEAQKLDARRVVLDTNRALIEAIAFYNRAGYREIDRYNDNPYAHFWFEKRFG